MPVFVPLSVGANYRAIIGFSTAKGGDKGDGCRHLFSKLFILPLQIADFTLEVCEDWIIWIGRFTG